MPKKKRSFFKTLMTVLIILIGIGLVIYPFVANYVFENRKDGVINTFERTVDNTEEKEVDKAWKAAEEYNKALEDQHVKLTDPFAGDKKTGTDEKTYNSLLSLQGTSMMGFINIPSIDVDLPIYHGTSEKVLRSGVGHLEGSSLPVGGESVHTILTSHSGLSNAKLFTDLTELENGDIFILNILGRKIAYEVDQIKIVKPYQVDDLSIVHGKDYCTLITCTPYGINTHRLLVRGKRIPYEEEVVEEKGEITHAVKSQWMQQYKKSLIVGGCVLIVILLISWILDKIRRKK